MDEGPGEKVGANWSSGQQDVYGFAIEIFGTHEAAHQWMHSPVSALGGATPLGLATLSRACIWDRS